MPLEPLVTAIQPALELAFHVQPGPAVTDTEPLPPPEGPRQLARFRIYREGLWRAAWGDGPAGPTLAVSGRVDDPGAIEPVRDPRAIGGIPRWLLVTVAILLLAGGLGGLQTAGDRGLDVALGGLGGQLGLLAGMLHDLFGLALHLADDAAYCAGVWLGCARERTLGPLLPRHIPPVGDDPGPEPGQDRDADHEAGGEGGARRAVDVEISPPRVAAIENPDMDVVHTNPFLRPVGTRSIGEVEVPEAPPAPAGPAPVSRSAAAGIGPENPGDDLNAPAYTRKYMD